MTVVHARLIPLLWVLVMLCSGVVSAQDVSPEAVEIRLQSLNTKAQPDLRAAAIKSLVQLGTDAVPILSPMLLVNERSWEQRTEIAWILGEIGDKKAVRSLEQAWALPSAPDTFRIQVATALAALEKLEPLHTYFKTPDSNKIFVAKAAIAAANLGDKSALPLLLPLKADPDIGSFVVLALGRLGEKSVSSTLRELLKESMFRDYAAVALAALGDKTVIFQLRFALDHGDSFVRRDAARYLGVFKDEEALKKLKMLAEKDNDPRVRKAAGVSIKRIERSLRRRR